MAAKQKRPTVADAMAKIDALADSVGTLAQVVSAGAAEPSEPTPKAEAKAEVVPDTTDLPTWQPLKPEGSSRYTRTFGVLVTSNGVARVVFANADSETGAPRQSEKSRVYGVGGVSHLRPEEIAFLLSKNGQAALRKAQDAADELNA